MRCADNTSACDANLLVFVIGAIGFNPFDDPSFDIKSIQFRVGGLAVDGFILRPIIWSLIGRRVPAKRRFGLQPA